MPEQERRLAAIMFSDIAGYTAIMQENEEKALKLLEKNRNLHKALIELYHGQFLKEIGDGILASFNAASDAVRCAGELQRVAKEDQDLKLHIGIHLGEVVFSENDVYGDGVNIASRIDSVTKDGEVYISEDVWKNIKNKEELQADYLGKRKFKNLKDPIGIYRLSKTGFDGKRQKKNKSSKALYAIIWASLIIAILSALLFVVFKDRLGQRSYDTRTSERSIAVLPFKSIEEGVSNEYFADGVMETITSYLCKINELTVISRTSVEQYRNSIKASPQIANELNVDFLLGGSVQKYENKLRITVQLIKAQENRHLWAETYDRELTDLFQIQSEIAYEVADIMQVQITSDESERILNQPTQSLEAYDSYIRGRIFWNKRTEAEMFRSKELFEQAVQIDPRFAQAWAGLADAYNMIVAYSHLSSDAGYREAEKAAKNAIRLNNGLAEAHSSLGWINAIYHHDWNASMEEFELAHQYEPSYSTAHHWHAWMYAVQGDFAKADLHIQIAIRLDPLSNIIMASAGWISFANGSYQKAVDHFKSAIEINPDFPRFHYWIGHTYMVMQEFDIAISHLRKSVELSNRNTQYLASLGFCLGYAGNIDEANKILDEIYEANSHRYVSSYDIGVALLGVENEELAMDYFMIALEAKNTWLPFMVVDPRFDKIRTNPRYIDIVEKLGLMEGIK